MHRVALFVYGTLLHPAVIRTVIGRVPRAQAATLRGYRRHALRGRPFPGLLLEPAAQAAGAVVEVRAAELARLDSYEADFYERRVVAVTLGGGRMLSAQTYVLRARYRGLATARAWPMQRFLARARRLPTARR